MKILQINKFFYMRGGAERYFFDLIDLLEEQEHEVIPFSMKDKRNKKSPYEKYFVSNVSFDKKNIFTFLKAGRIFYSPEAKRKLKQLIKDTKPDIAHVHLMYHQLSPSVLLALKKFGIPTVMTIHDWQPLNPNYSLAVPDHVYSVEEGKKYWNIVKQKAIKGSKAMSMLAAASAIVHHKLGWYEHTVHTYIAPSEFAQKLFYKYGWPKKQVVHIPHFVRNIPKVVKKKKSPYILYAGRLSWEKGIDRLVEYWCKEQIPYTLKIAGDGPMKEKLKETIKYHDAKHEVELHGFVQPDKLQDMMSEAAAVIAPSVIYETFGLSITEAMAAGTGVIASNMGPFPEFIKGTGAGELFDWKKKNSLKKTVESYMKHEAKWSGYGQKGRELVKKRFTKEAHYKALLRLYESLV